MAKINSEQQKVINIFKKYKTEIGNIKSIPEGNIWKTKVKESILKYIGEGPLNAAFEILYFSKPIKVLYDDPSHYLKGPNWSTKHVFDEEKKVTISKFMDNIIDHISNNGILNTTNVKNNLASNLSQFEFWCWACGVAIFLITTFYSIGYYFGQSKIDREFEDLKDLNKSIINELESEKKLSDSKDNLILILKEKDHK